MFFKKILFFIFLISSVSIPGYYFYQRSKSKKEESYPVNNKEAIQEEPIQEEKKEEEPTIKNEEVTLVEINGWLDCLLLNTLFYFLIFYLFLTLFKVRLSKTDITSFLNKVSDEQLASFFATFFRRRFIDPSNIDVMIINKKKEFVAEIKCPPDELTPDERMKLRLNNQRKLGDLYKIKCCFDKGKFFNCDEIFVHDFVDAEISSGRNNIKMKFPTVFFIIFFIITHIFLGYDLYFLMKSFWQVGFSKTFENLNWLDLFSIEKVFRRNSIMKKIAFLVSFILTTGFTFYWIFFKADQSARKKLREKVENTLETKINERQFGTCLTTEEENNCRLLASRAINVELQNNSENIP